MELWVQPTLVNIDALVGQLTSSVNQSVTEYSLEQHFLRKPVEIQDLHETILKPCEDILERGISQGCPSIQKVYLELSLPSWAITTFVLEVKEFLNDLSPGEYQVVSQCFLP